MATMEKAAVEQLAAEICRRKLWTTPEETAAWLKTETGQRIAALIDKQRKKAVA